MILCPVIARLLFQPVTTFVRNLDVRIWFPVVDTLVLIFISAEEFQPFLWKLHPAVFRIMPLRTALSCDNRMTYRLIILRRILQCINTPSNLLTDHRKSNLIKDCDLAFVRFYNLKAKRFVHSLNAPVLNSRYCNSLNMYPDTV